MRLQDVASCPIVEPSQLGSNLHTLNIVGVALDPSRFAGYVSHVDLGDVAVEIVRSSPALLIERVESGRAGCLLMLEGAERAKWDGRSIDRCDVAALMPETTLMGSFQDPFAMAFVSTSHDGPEAILGSWAWMKCGRAGLPVQRSATPAHARLSTCLREIERLARYAPDVLRDEPSRTGPAHIARGRHAETWQSSRGRHGRQDQVNTAAPYRLPRGRISLRQPDAAGLYGRSVPRSWHLGLRHALGLPRCVWDQPAPLLEAAPHELGARRAPVSVGSLAVGEGRRSVIWLLASRPVCPGLPRHFW